MTDPTTDTRRPVAKALGITGAGIVLSLSLSACMTTAPRDSGPYGNGPYDDGGYDNGGYADNGRYDYGDDTIPGTGYAGQAVVQPRRIQGTIETRDFTRDGVRERDGRSAVFHMTIGADGRVQDCRAYQSSGIPDLDAFTCRLIETRFVYEPARDAQGRPVPGVAGWQQSWYLPRR